MRSRSVLMLVCRVSAVAIASLATPATSASTIGRMTASLSSPSTEQQAPADFVSVAMSAEFPWSLQDGSFGTGIPSAATLRAVGKASPVSAGE